ncbi:hypothetical protein TNCV_1881011 [Trichonephila clavipes]|nr:hypothetical protein TNCV_1881011 [Trichonephila clavipes]
MEFINEKLGILSNSSRRVIREFVEVDSKLSVYKVSALLSSCPENTLAIPFLPRKRNHPPHSQDVTGHCHPLT